MRKIKQAAMTVVLGAVVLLAADFVVAQPRIAAAKISRPPALDGILDDPVWQDAARLDSFTLIKGGQPVTDTVIRLARGDSWLFLGVECFNPHMQFLNQLGLTHEDNGIIKDDSIEIFFWRDGLEHYYQYLLNFAGVRGERRVSVAGTGRDFSWDYPWVAVAARTTNGWTAEIALPLDVVNGAKSGDVRINFLRNKVDVELDAMGAKNSEKMTHSLWAPVEKSVHEAEHFGRLEGLADFQAVPPFLPQVVDLGAGNLKLDGDVFGFDVAFRILGRSAVAGQAQMAIVEKLRDGEKTLFEKELDLPPRCEKNYAFSIPVADFSPKTLAVRLMDQTTGMKLDERRLDFRGTLIAEAYPEFNYYTKDNMFRVKARMNLSAETLRGMSLALTDGAGQVLAAGKDPAPETVLSAKVAALEPGDNNLTMMLKRGDGRVMGSVALTVRRLPPGPGSEVQVDHFRRIVRLNGAPFFPFGMYVHGGDHGLRYPEVQRPILDLVEKSAMNTIILTSSFFNDDAAMEAEKILAAEIARRGIYFALWNPLYGAPDAALKERFEKLTSFSDKAELTSQNYMRVVEPPVRRTMAAMRHVPNFLFWYGWDEPNLGASWQLNLLVQKLFYATQRECDPYHPMFGLYARYIPTVPEAVDCFDALGYDVYTYPQWENSAYADVAGSMAAQTAQLDARAAERRQPVWMVPMGTALDPGRSPRVLTGQEQMCQSYVAIISGARGLLYFCYTSTYGKDSWDALRELGLQVRQIAPAILAEPVAQKIAYASGEYDLLRWQCPPVPFRFFRYPDGQLMALAVNAKNCPVDLTVKIAGLRGARRKFGDQAVFTVADQGFVDNLEPFAVRAYALDIDETPGKLLSVSISDTAHPEAAQTIVSNDALIKQARERKNLVLNPSLEMQKTARLPDFYSPYLVLEADMAGVPGSRWFLDPDQPKFGKVSLCMNRPPANAMFHKWRTGVFGVFGRPPQPEAPHVFSFYARAATNGATLWVGLPTVGKGAWNDKVFTLTTAWQRYTMPAALDQLPVNPNMLFQPTCSDTAIWLDGLQLEQGETPTEFAE